MDDRLENSLATALGSRVLKARPLTGGDINEAFEVDLADGRAVFVKCNASAPNDMFVAEARGLAWLGDAKALRVPAVLAASGANDLTPFLALELIRPAPRAPNFDERLGRGWRRCTGTAEGVRVGSRQLRRPGCRRRTPSARWPEFYRVRRLGPQLRAAADAGLAPPRMRRDFERLLAQLETLCGPPEPPARLHGDLWGGNMIADDLGEPCLIDPAAYGGHREIDLAMMKLFGLRRGCSGLQGGVRWPTVTGSGCPVPALPADGPRKPVWWRVLGAGRGALARLLAGARFWRAGRRSLAREHGISNARTHGLKISTVSLGLSDWRDIGTVGRGLDGGASPRATG
jgi:fructosamine-3-kinase